MSSGFPKTSYLVCATHRSGSNLLCQALWHTKRAGFPQETFSPTRASLIAREQGIPYDPEKQFACYVSALMRLRQTANEVFGAKLMWSQVGWFMERLKADPSWPGPPHASFAEVLPSVFPDLKLVWMRRRDKVRQAISLVKAKQTKIYNSLQEAEAPPVPDLQYDFKAIDKAVARFSEDDASWGQFFHLAEFDPVTIVYEDFVENKDEGVREILRRLGENVPDDYQAPATNYKRLADAVNEEWCARYTREKGAAGG